MKGKDLGTIMWFFRYRGGKNLQEFIGKGSHKPANLPTLGYMTLKKIWKALKALLQKSAYRRTQPCFHHFFAISVVICSSAKLICPWHVQNVTAPGRFWLSGVEKIVCLSVQQRLSSFSPLPLNFYLDNATLTASKLLPCREHAPTHQPQTSSLWAVARPDKFFYWLATYMSDTPSKKPTLKHFLS